MTTTMTTHAILVRILVDRYEDTSTGYQSQADALVSAREYLDALIAKPATFKCKDGTIEPSLAAKADRFDVIGETCEDNGEENDGDDIGRWTIAFEIAARFVVTARTRKEAEETIMAEIDGIISDPIGDSVEEWACNFSADILRNVTK
jgi:hypothetical protein